MRPIRSLAVAALALTLGLLALSTPARADIVPGQYSLEANASTTTAPVGGQFTVSVGVFHTAGAYQAVQWALEYNEAAVSIASISDSHMPGTCLKSDNGTRVLLGCIETSGPSLTYSGSAFDIVFNCNANGTAGLAFDTSPPINPTFVKSGTAALPSHIHTASVQCGSGGGPPPPPPPGDHCTVASVLTGDTFTCSDGRTVRMLQIDAQDPNQCGGGWAKAALQYIFLAPGRIVTLEYDSKQNASGQTLAAPLWTGFDGNVYNLSIVMVYVGLAKAADLGDGNVEFLDWANASQVWASVAQWNMWAPGKTYTGGCD